MNTAASHLERNIANGEKTRELLGQSLGFENELIGQTKFPHQPSSRGAPRARLIFTSPAGSSPDVLEPVPDCRLLGGICRQREELGKVESWADRRCGQRDECAISRTCSSRLIERPHAQGCGARISCR